MKANGYMKGLAIAMVSFSLLTACDSGTELNDDLLISAITVETDGTTSTDSDVLKTSFLEMGGVITDDLAEWLKFMREEEKVARDLYTSFYELYNIPVFKNIARAEQTHMNAALALLEIYAIEDPADVETGVFNNTELQNLYNDLLEKGSASVEEALGVGALVEEVDIADLDDVYALNPGEDFKTLAEALKLGSRNHLRAFNRNLTFRDIDYMPQVLSQEDFDAIVNSPWETGSGICRR